jgi:tetratricopeptide (TPR) repeat protein
MAAFVNIWILRKAASGTSACVLVLTLAAQSTPAFGSGQAFQRPLPDRDGRWQVAYDAGWEAQRRGSYHLAEKMFRLAIEELQPLWEEDWRASHTNEGLTWSLFMQGKYSEAQSPAEWAMAARLKILGPDNAHVGRSLRLLAMIHNFQAKYATAESLYLRAASTAEKSLGGDDPELALCLTGLADLYRKEARYAEAEQLCKR